MLLALLPVKFLNIERDKKSSNSEVAVNGYVLTNKSSRFFAFFSNWIMGSIDPSRDVANLNDKLVAWQIHKEPAVGASSTLVETIVVFETK